MTEDPKPITDDDLHRFVDGRLETERRQEIAAYLAEHPEVAQEVEAYRRLNAELRARYEPLREEPIPTPLLRAAAQGRVPRPADLRYALRVAAQPGASKLVFDRSSMADLRAAFASSTSLSAS